MKQPAPEFAQHYLQIAHVLFDDATSFLCARRFRIRALLLDVGCTVIIVADHHRNSATKRERAVDADQRPQGLRAAHSQAATLSAKSFNDPSCRATVEINEGIASGPIKTSRIRPSAKVPRQENLTQACFDAANRLIPSRSRAEMYTSEMIQYGSLKQGPEAPLQHAVEGQLLDLFPQQDRLVWRAGSAPIGAGKPDIILAGCAPEVVALDHKDVRAKALLAYLRMARKAKLSTMAERLGYDANSVKRSIEGLLESKIVLSENDSFRMSDPWKSVLPEIVTIEAKVGDWRRALNQAVRNQLFAHRSFVALPCGVASRAKEDETFKRYGIGILSVENCDSVRVLRHARRATPRIWLYYYLIASLAAEYFNGARGAVRSRH
ncbi:hypothetical protein [Bradyrhizobium quebecense]|uniref:Uncharacterized protein n=2 Tax=Bradyrhizobium quebecense TaxID=2748629 RepID=A0ABS3MBY4_9BRAD|nr:hypothetical protein [Bradyrhizobium quebecense]UGY04327.1 hypothetical protein J4P68_0006105 [Bradyrhizobium quebecense]